MTYRMVIFDFDGTLADTFPFFTSVFNDLAKKYDFKVVDDSVIDSLRHLSAQEVMQRVEVSKWKLPLIARDFKKRMWSQVSAIRLFDGIPEVLQELHSKGIVLTLVSSNSRDNIKTVLGDSVFSLFDHMECGMSIFGKARRILNVVKKANISRGEVIYIGDQITDHQASRDAKIAFGAVAWGYGSIESLRIMQPEREFHEIHELISIASEK